MSNNIIPQTPEAVAYQLMKDILIVECKCIGQDPNPTPPLVRATKQDILNTYSECIKIVKLQS